MYYFKKTLIAGKICKIKSCKTIKIIEDFLVSIGTKVIFDENIDNLLNKKHSENKIPTKLHYIPKDCDLIIVVGGDGSLLSLVDSVIKTNIPILGINRGRLGFLTDVHPSNMLKLFEIFSGKYSQEERTLLEVMSNSIFSSVSNQVALNDVVLSSPNPGHMMEFFIKIDGSFEYSQRADGIIVSTPTGSTAYALSAGGTILDPKLDFIELIPMLPHTLNNRPIIIHPSSTIEISSRDNNFFYLSCDGKTRNKVSSKLGVKIKKSSLSIKLIHPQDYSYFRVLSEKLGWSKFF